MDLTDRKEKLGGAGVFVQEQGCGCVRSAAEIGMRVFYMW